MTSEESFLQAIIDRPDDDAPRLIYADWLEENGRTGADRARAEFIRVQVELERLPADDDRRAELAARQDQLLAKHWADWVRPLEPFGHVTGFRRGFPEGVALNSWDPTATVPWMERLSNFLQRAPACRLMLYTRGSAWPDRPAGRGHPLPPPGESDLELLAASPLLRRLTALDVNLRGLLVGDTGDFRPGIAALGRSSHAVNLAALNLDGHWQQGRDLLRALTAASHLPRLTDLSLAGTGM